MLTATAPWWKGGENPSGANVKSFYGQRQVPLRFASNFKEKLKTEYSVERVASELLMLNARKVA